MNRNLKFLIAAGLVAFVGGLYFLISDGKDIQSSNDQLADVTVPELSDPSIFGKGVFDANCAACHGVNAAGKNGFGPPLIHKIYEPSHHGDRAFYLAIKNGVRQHHWPFGNMPAQSHVSDADIKRIITYVREMQRANDIL